MPPRHLIPIGGNKPRPLAGEGSIPSDIIEAGERLSCPTSRRRWCREEEDDDDDGDDREDGEQKNESEFILKIGQYPSLAVAHPPPVIQPPERRGLLECRDAMMRSWNTLSIKIYYQHTEAAHTTSLRPVSLVHT